MIQQRLLKLEEPVGSKRLDDRVHNLKGTDVAEHFGSEVPEVVESIQSISVVVYQDLLHVYVLVTTSNSLSAQVL